MTYSPAIVIVAYNRPKSLERLLFSIKHAKSITNARLIISIDNNEPGNFDVRNLADAFDWPFGEKEVIYQKQRIGLRKHVLQCGDYAKVYGSVIILEDDLFVSPYFYDYAVKALSYYDHHENIGGISLYNQPREEVSQKPFTPLNDNSDVYFLQFPSSLGQAWTKRQWEQFRNWYNLSPDIQDVLLPDKVSKWPETSWKKYFCAFLVLRDLYVVFPRISFTTNFNDPGTNLMTLVNHDGQSTLKLCASEYKFTELKDSFSIYDVHLEIVPDCITRFSDTLKEYDFEVDLYGMKNLDKISKPYLITSKPVKNFIYSFKRALKPHELNVIFNLKGDEIFLCKREDAMIITNIKGRFIEDYKYYYFRRLPSVKILFYNYISRRMSKFKKALKKW